MSDTHVALKKFTVGKREYNAGDAVDASSWPFRRDILLEGQRFIKRLVPRNRAYVASRDGIELAGTTYAKGGRIDTSDLSSDKIDQLVTARIILIDDSAAEGGLEP